MAKRRSVLMVSHPYAYLVGGALAGIAGTLLVKKYLMPAAPAGQALTPGGLDVFDMGQHMGVNLSPIAGASLSGESNWRLINGRWTLVDGLGRVVRYA